MADPEPSKKNSAISLGKLIPRNLLLIIVFTAFFWISESSSASANTTTLSGKFYVSMASHCKARKAYLLFQKHLWVTGWEQISIYIVLVYDTPTK